MDCKWCGYAGVKGRVEEQVAEIERLKSALARARHNSIEDRRARDVGVDRVKELEGKLATSVGVCSLIDGQSKERRERADKAEAALAESQARVAVLTDALDAEMGSCRDARDQHDCQLCGQGECPMRDAFFAEAVKARRPDATSGA